MVKVLFNSKDVVVDFEKDSALLVHGKVGMGATNFLHVTIKSLQEQHEPSALSLRLADFTGVEFTPYIAGSDKLIDKVYNIRKEKERAQMTSELQELLNSRIRLLAQKGHHNFEQAVAAGEDMKRVIVIMNELPELNDVVIVDHLVRLGRSTGVHLVVTSHSSREDVLRLFPRKVEVNRAEAYVDGKTIEVPFIKWASA